MKTPDEIKRGLECCSMYPNRVECMRSCPYESEELHCIPMLVADARAYIQQLEAKIPQWISAKERLPEKEGKCIVCTAKGSIYCTRFKAYGGGGNFQTDTNTHITHWMPLPEPPKEE